MHRSLAPPPLPLMKMSASVTGTWVGSLLGLPAMLRVGAPVTGNQLSGKIAPKEESAVWFRRKVTSARGGMNFRRVLDVLRVGRQNFRDTRMAAVEYPTPLNPHAITNCGPHVLWHRAPSAVVVIVDLHQACIVPLDLHVQVMTGYVGCVVEVRTLFFGYNASKTVNQLA